MIPHQMPKNIACIDISDRFFKNYTLKNLLRKGSDDEIYIGQKAGGFEEVIIKKIPNNFLKKNVDGLSAVIDSMIYMSSIKKSPHENILNNYDLGIDTQTKDLYEIAEYCEEGKIQTTGLDQDEILNIIYQVAQGLNQLHINNIIHKNIQPDKIFVKTVGKKKIYKISCLELDHLSNMNNKNSYIAPEYFQGKQLTNKFDIWALGILLHNLLFGKQPFPKNPSVSSSNKYIQEKYIFPLQAAKSMGYNNQLKDLLENMLQAEPTVRFSAQEVIVSIDIMKKFSNLPDMNSSDFNHLEKPSKILSIKMDYSICVGGRGFTAATVQKMCFYYSLDSAGFLQKIDPDKNKIILKKSVDLGKLSDYNSVIANKAESHLLVTGYSNTKMYIVDPKNLETLYCWKQTHNCPLNCAIFLENNIICAGYEDGFLKVFNIMKEEEKGSFKINGSEIKCFETSSARKELIVGDGSGRLMSIYWEGLHKINWKVDYHSTKITSIQISEKYMATGSADNFLIIMNFSAPPEMIKKIDIHSCITQILTIPKYKGILVMCAAKILFLEDENKSASTSLKRLADIDFEGNNLQSFIKIVQDNVIVGDNHGILFSMKLVSKQL